MGVNIERTYDAELIKSVLLNEEIWEAIKDDYAKKEDLVLDFDKNIFLHVIVDGQTAGVYILHAFNSVTLQIHANILPEFREEFANSSGSAVLEWIDNEVDPHFKKLIAFIPIIYPNVYWFSLHHGFSDEGLLKAAHFQNGELHDIHVVGRERRKIGDLIHGFREREVHGRC